MFSSCIRGCHYDFVVTNTWKVSFKNSSVPFKFQHWGVRQSLRPAFTAFSASCLHTKHEQLSHRTSRMWEPNHCLGTSSPCRAISKTCLGRKRGHQFACFQLVCASRFKKPVSCSTLRYITWGHGAGWKLLRNKRTHACFTSREKQECSSNRSCSKDGVIHKPPATDTGIKLKL